MNEGMMNEYNVPEASIYGMSSLEHLMSFHDKTVSLTITTSLSTAPPHQ